jgi:bifunctional DNA-binding transcriptional regulator/antitoxin component of YhaV-PrlF toxin-antitoxin module
VSIVSKLEDNSTTRIPEEIVKKARLKPGDDIIWYYDEVYQQIIISAKPINFAKALRGLGQGTWEDVEPLEYVQEERESW